MHLLFKFRNIYKISIMLFKKKIFFSLNNNKLMLFKKFKHKTLYLNMGSFIYTPIKIIIKSYFKFYLISFCISFI